MINQQQAWLSCVLVIIIYQCDTVLFTYGLPHRSGVNSQMCLNTAVFAGLWLQYLVLCQSTQTVCVLQVSTVSIFQMEQYIGT